MLSTLFVCRQVEAQQQIFHYVFDTFSKGKVQVKSGIVSEQLLNYNILTNEMIFDNGGKFMAIGNPADVDTVFINSRKFVPVENRFYEVLTNSPMPLFMEFKASIDEPTASVGYGNASPVTNATYISTLVKSGDVYGLKLPDDFKVTPSFAFYILKDGKYIKFSNAKQLGNIFTDKKKLITGLSKKNNSRFSKREDMILLISQLRE